MGTIARASPYSLINQRNKLGRNEPSTKDVGAGDAGRSGRLLRARLGVFDYLYANAGEEFYLYAVYKVWPMAVFAALSLAGFYCAIRFLFELFVPLRRP